MDIPLVLLYQFSQDDTKQGTLAVANSDFLNVI